MGVPVIQGSPVNTNPGGTGTTITAVLPAHQEDDILICHFGWRGNQVPTTLTGWDLWFSQATGNASIGCGQGLWWRRVGVGETVSDPTLTIGSTAVERIAQTFCVRGADIDNPANTFWLKQQTAGNSTSPTPPGITTLAPNYLILHLVTCRGNTAVTEPTGYNEEADVAVDSTLAVQFSSKTQATADTLTNQSATISSGRWVAAILAIPSPDYPYFRSQTSQVATATSITGTLPTGTTAADFYGRKDLIKATVAAEGTAPSPNTAGDWTEIATWSTTTSGGVTTVRQYWALYDGTIDLQFNRSGVGEIALNLATYRNPHQTSPIGNVNVRQNASSTTGTWDAQNRLATKSTVTATCIADGTPAYTAPAGWTERADGNGITVADQIFDASGSTAGASFTLSTASPTAVGLVEILSHAGASAAVRVSTAKSEPADSAQPSIATNSFEAISGNLIVVEVRCGTGAVSSITDTAGNTYVLAISDVSQDPKIFIYYAKNITGHATNVVTVNFSPSAEFSWAYAVQYSGLDTVSPLDAVDVKTGTGVTDLVSDPFSTVTAGVVVLAVSQSAFTTYTAGADFTLLDGAIGNSIGNDFGGVEERITSGPLSSYTAHITSGVTNSYTLALAAFKIASGMAVVTPGAATLALTGFAPKLNQTVTPAKADLSLTTFAPTAQQGSTVTPPNASLSLTTFAPQLKQLVTPASSALALTTLAPIARVNNILTVPNADLSLTAFAPVMGLTLTPAFRSFALSAFAPQLQQQLTPDSRTLSFATFAPQLREQTTPISQTLNLTTFAPSISQRAVIVPDSRTLNLSTFAPQLNQTLTPQSQALTFSTFAPQLQTQITPASRTLNLTTFEPSIQQSGGVTPASANLTLTTFSPQLQQRVTVPERTLALTTFAPSVSVGVMATPDAASLSLSAFAPQLRQQTTPASTTLTLAGFAPAIGLSVVPGNANLSLAVFAPQLQTVLTPQAANLTLTAFAPLLDTTITITPGSRLLSLTALAPVLQTTVTAGSASIALTRFAPVLRVTNTPATATLALTAFAPQIQSRIVIGSRALILTTFAPSLGLSTTLDAALVLQVPADSRTVEIKADSRTIIVPAPSIREGK